MTDNPTLINAEATDNAALPISEATDNPALLVAEAVDRCLTLAETWLAWDGTPIVTDGANLWTPAKAVRRVQDHLIDHLAEVEALLAGATPLESHWHGRMVTLDADWARFTELDLAEARSRWTRLGQAYVNRYATAPDAWDLPRSPNWTLREIAEHVAGITWYAEQVGALRFGDSARIR
ncbi:hypothetical protein [Nonomuraea sp. NEAU-A123]|uniref:hypothetical protein n=1 Tax=Nonomuraea sp. NEAU-A123 TaxID=2839649 RepID=UPI001BE4DA7C|nr:hypothetical protein [Nonomuraea sp. NEAU-A123]MBT2229784.1 hypothetical protein [Nonomuraea sp. NEAU-A123]